MKITRKLGWSSGQKEVMMGQKMENWMNTLQERAEVDNERANIWK